MCNSIFNMYLSVIIRRKYIEEQPDVVLPSSCTTAVGTSVTVLGFIFRAWRLTLRMCSSTSSSSMRGGVDCILVTTRSRLTYGMIRCLSAAIFALLRLESVQAALLRM